MPDVLWFPRSPFARVSNCIFVGRIIDKARRKASGLSIGEYMYGDNDYMDSRVLKFLRTSATDVDALVKSQPSDDVAARALVERSGRSPKEIASFNARMLLAYGVVFVMFDADEGRKTGPLANALAFFYNRIIYPPFAKKYSRDEARAKA